MEFCPDGVMSIWGYVRRVLCPGGVLSDHEGLCPKGVCPAGIMSWIPNPDPVILSALDVSY